MKDIIKSVIVEFQQRDLPIIKRRNIAVAFNTPMIVTLIGVRRSGKTYLLYDTIQEVVKNGVPIENILFINFEDERLNLQSTDLDLILQAYLELYPDKNLNDCYFFFDEIQNVTGWERFVRRIFDSYSKHIFVTGSNSRVLSTEIADALRGRTITYTVYPLSFSEYLNFRDVEYNTVTTAQRANITHQALQFIQNGGFPETINLNDDVRIKALQGYFNTMIFRDIVERYKVSDVRVLKYFIKKLFAGIGKPLSINKIYNDLRSLGYKVSNNYLYEFEQHAYAVFLSLSIQRFHYSEIKQEKSEKKCFAIDTGLLSAVEFSMSENKGKLLENAVLLELIKKGADVFFFKDKYECDFVYRLGSTLTPMQVAWQLQDDSSYKRETRGLLEACKRLNCKNGKIITFDQKGTLDANSISIELIPFYEWAKF